MQCMHVCVIPKYLYACVIAHRQDQGGDRVLERPGVVEPPEPLAAAAEAVAGVDPPPGRT